MKLVSQLRKDILTTINHFVASRYSREIDLPKNRFDDILNIKSILIENDPLKIRSNLLGYINQMSKGILCLFPFLEVNQLKNSIAQVLNQPEYKEIGMLKSLLKECETLLKNDRASNKIDLRFAELEQQISFQAKKATKFEQEIQRLSIENQFLCQTIQLLTEKNQKTNQQKTIIHEKLKKTIVEYDKLNEQYQIVIEENRQLKQKLELFNDREFFSSSVSKNQIDIKNFISHNSLLSKNENTMQKFYDNSKLKRRHSIA